MGYSVLDMVKAFEKASGKPVPYQIVGRRSGDVATVYAATDLAATELGWKAERGLDQMCTSIGFIWSFTVFAHSLKNCPHLLFKKSSLGKF